MSEFKLIVAGGRDFNNYELLSSSLHELDIDGDISIVSGMAQGADALGYRFAKENNVVLYTFPANWNLHGKRAGFIRNEEMGRFADGLLAFWNGSKGTAHMINFMKMLNKPVHIISY